MTALFTLTVSRLLVGWELDANESGFLELLSCAWYPTAKRLCRFLTRRRNGGTALRLEIISYVLPGWLKRPPRAGGRNRFAIQDRVEVIAQAFWSEAEPRQDSFEPICDRAGHNKRMAKEGERERESFWVLRAQSGDKDALNSLLKSFQDRLYRYIFSLVSEQHLAEDILQEVFLRIYRKLGWLREPQLFRPWAYQIATRETFRYLKRERPWREQVRNYEMLESRPAMVPDDAFAPELLERLPQLLANLSPASRAVIVLYYLHEMSFGETAAVLGIPVGTVKSRLSYGLEGLRRQLNS